MAATGSNDKKIRIWDIKTGSLKSTLTGCLQSVMCVSFNATDELLLGASNDNAARLWHLGTGRPRVSLFFSACLAVFYFLVIAVVIGEIFISCILSY
jgi:WD40 repeat protein